MVAEFEKAVLAMKPGEISPVVETSFGFHVIYRSTFAEVKDKFTAMVGQRNAAIADSIYLARAEANAKVTLEKDAPIKAKAIARNVLGFAKDKSVLAKYQGGELTSAEFADWIAAYPPQQQIRPQLVAAPDSMVEKFVKQIVRNELMQRAADSAKVTVDTNEVNNLYLNFKNAVMQAWSGLGVDPAKLADSAKAGGDKGKIASSRVEAFFDKLVKNEVPYVDVPYPMSRALQHKYDFSVSDAGLDKAVDLAKAVRASADSSKAKQVQTPGGAAPGDAPAAPPAEAAPAPAPTPTPAKKP
jgi:hypothetical protein